MESEGLFAFRHTKVCKASKGLRAPQNGRVCFYRSVCVKWPQMSFACILHWVEKLLMWTWRCISSWCRCSGSVRKKKKVHCSLKTTAGLNPEHILFLALRRNAWKEIKQVNEYVERVCTTCVSVLNLTECEGTFELFACQNTLCGLQLVHSSATVLQLLTDCCFQPSRGWLCFTTYGLVVKYFSLSCKISNAPLQHRYHHCFIYTASAAIIVYSKIPSEGCFRI